MIYILVNRNYQFEYIKAAVLLPGLSGRQSRSRKSLSPIVSCTYARNSRNSRKSFIALLLPAVFPVSPLLHHSYKKMGGRGRGVCVPTHSVGVAGCRFFQPLASNFQPPVRAPFRPCVTPLESAIWLRSRENSPSRPCVSPLESTMSRIFPKKRPCLNPLDSNGSRPLEKRPCLSPLESHSCEKNIFSPACDLSNLNYRHSTMNPIHRDLPPRLAVKYTGRPIGGSFPC